LNAIETQGGREYLTRSEVAELFGVNVRTIIRSDMPFVRFGRAVRYSRAAVKAWAEGGGMKTKEKAL